LIRSADQLAAANSVDPLANLQNQKVFVFHGYKDDVISRKITDLTVEFYRHYMGDRYGNIFYQDSIGAGNGIATVDRGLPCGGTASPYIYACNYDQAGIMLQYFYGALRANTGRALQGKILTFDQGRYTVANPDAYNLGDTGYIYVPDSCARGELCRVHIALHGCRQDAGTISDFYVKKAGYNEWADDNHIIVLYPQSRAATYNPNACWDWWGFDSPAYGTHQSPQMSAIMAMLKVVTAGFTPQSPSSTTTVIAPADVKVIDISATGAALTWTAVGGAATYRIYRSPGGNNPFKAVGDVVGPSFGELGLTPATGYRWRVTAIKDGVESRPSSDIAARTLEAPVGQ